MLRQFPHNVALQNTDSGVLQKSSKHFLIFIFFPPFSFRTPPPPPPSKKNIIQKMRTYLFTIVQLQMCFVNIYMQYSLTKYGFWSASEIIFQKAFSYFHFLLSGEGGHPLPVPLPLGYFVPRTISTYFFTILQFKMCVVNIYIQNSLTKYGFQCA